MIDTDGEVVRKFRAKSTALGGAILPLAGAGSRGDIIEFTNPVAGGNLGSVCVTSGAPSAGTWKQYGAVAA